MSPLRPPSAARPHMACFIYHDRFDLSWQAHVFPTQKYRLLHDQLIAERLVRPQDFLTPEKATREQLLRVHTNRYLDELERIARDPNGNWLPFEAPLDERVLDAVLYGTGGTLLAGREALRIGAAMNLSGGFHHAFPDHGEGFCFINDVAVAIRTLQCERPAPRIAVVDCDLHQGNGTAHAFRADPTVFTFSIHQEHLYPIKQRSALDVGLEDFAGDEEYLSGLKGGLEAIFGSFKPALVFYLAGADPFERDQLGSLRVTKDGLRRRDRMVIEACRTANAPIAIVLAGGYPPDIRDVVDIHFATAAELLREGGS